VIKPKKVIILGREFEVKSPTKVGDDDHYGDCDGAERVIRVRASLKGESFEDVLLHETIHGVLYTAGISEMLGDRLEEALVVALENGLGPLYKRKY